MIIENITHPIISIQKKKTGVIVACLRNHGDFIRDFEYYESEEKGIEQAKQFFIDNNCTLEPKIVRPKITKMVLRYGK